MLHADRKLASLCLRPRFTHSVLRRCPRRALATEAAAANAASPSSSPDRLVEVPYQRKRSRSVQTVLEPKKDIPQRETLFVRPWDGISSMPEFFAIIRTIERKFGRIREYNLGRDYDLPHIYIPHFWVLFHDPEAMQRVPRKPTVLKAEVPVVDVTRPGGPGLDELSHLLQPQDYVPPGDEELINLKADPAKGSAKTRTVDLRLERGKAPIVMAFRDEVFRGNDRRFLEGFYAWGGFAPPAAGAPEATRYMREGKSKWEYIVQRGTKKGRTEALDPHQIREDRENEVTESRLDEAALDAMDWPAELERSAEPVSVSPFPSSEPTAPSISPADMSDPPQTPEITAAAAPPPTSTMPKAGPSRRDRILEQARLNARTPLPASVKPTPEDKEEKRLQRQREMEEEERMRVSLRERLWKLMGGKWF